MVATELHGVKLQPMASFDYLHLWRSRINEFGAGALDLLVNANEIDSMVFSVGARAYTEFEFERNYMMAPELWVRWGHEFGDVERRINAVMRGSLGTPGSRIVVTGVEAARDSVYIGGGWSVSGPNNLNLFINYAVAINSVFISHAIRAGALIPF